MSLYQRLIRDVFHPVALWGRGDLARLRYLKEFERTQYLPLENFREMQFERLKALLAHAYRQCAFYKERFDAAGVHPNDLESVEDLRLFPVLEKRDIQDSRDAMVSRDWPRDDLIPYGTGGSTGASLSFFLSKERTHSRWAAQIRHDRWANWNVGDKVAILWGAPGDQIPDTFRSRLHKLLLDPHVFLNTGHITEARMVEFYETMNRFRPDVIQAYSRSAGLFARFLKSRGLKAWRPRAVVTSAEVLEPEDREVIEEVFGCPVFNRYGCREVGMIASECSEHDGLHLMAEGIHLEVVRNGRPAEPGEDGEILVTDLMHRAMPLIRYRIGDVGAWEEGSCRCGRSLPRLRRVTGRATDFLVGHDGRMVAGPFLAHSLVAKCPGLAKLQIRQDRIGQIHLRIKPSTKFTEADHTEFLQATVRRYLGEATDVGWEFVDELPTESSGKYLFCRSSVAPAFLRRTAGSPGEVAKESNAIGSAVETRADHENP